MGRWQSCPAFNSFEIFFAEAWTAKARCPQGQVEKFRTPRLGRSRPAKQAATASCDLARTKETSFFLIEFPLDLERVAPFPAGSYVGIHGSSQLRPERNSSHFVRRVERKINDRKAEKLRCAAPSIQPLPSQTALTCLLENVQNR